MAHIMLRWLLNAIGIYIASLICRGINLTSPLAVLLASAIFGLVNTKIRPFLIAVTLPINILSLGLFTLVINTMIFWISALITPGFSAGVLSSFIGAILVSIITFSGDIIYEERAGVHYGWRKG